MPHVEVSTLIRGDRFAIYELAKDMESYPRFAPDVDSVKVIDRGPGYTVTAWQARLQGKPFRWTERDEFDDQTPGIRYRQVDGDLKRFEGEWRFEAQGEDCKVTLTVDFELGIPMFAAMLNPIARVVVKKNSEGLLEGLRRRAGAS